VVLAALIYAKREHLYQVDSLSMTLVSDQWIPLEGLHELPLVEELQRQGRRLLEAAAVRRQEWWLLPERAAAGHRGWAVPVCTSMSAFLDPKEQSAKEKAVLAAGEGRLGVADGPGAAGTAATRAGARESPSASDPTRGLRIPEVG
jgi:hypothetical protein